MAALPRLSMAPDSPLATRNSRHPLTEAGFDTIIRNMEIGLKHKTAGEPDGRIRYEGLETADGLDTPCHKIVRDAADGEHWIVYVDPETHLPALVQATSSDGALLERYRFRDPVFNLPELASAEAFEPDARWGAAPGLLSRLARSAAANAPEPDATQTR